MRHRLKDYSNFVLEKEREPGMLEFNQVSESYVEKIIGENMATRLYNGPNTIQINEKI